MECLLLVFKDSTCNLPLLTKLGIKDMPNAQAEAEDQTEDSGRADSEKGESDNTDEGNEEK